MNEIACKFVFFGGIAAAVAALCTVIHFLLWWWLETRTYLRLDRIAAAHSLQRKPGESNKELARRIYHVNPSAVSVLEF